MSTMKRIGVALAFLTSACASDLREDLPDEPQAPNSGKIVTTGDGSALKTTTVDATSPDAWIYMRLESGKEVTPADPASSTDWDLAFQRFKIKLNGGVSGSGGVEAIALAAADFSSIVDAPPAGYVRDADDSEDADPDPDYAFSVANAASDTGWYNYNATDHTLSPADVVYVVRSTSGRFYKIEMLGYYDSAGTAGHPKFQWSEVRAPEGSGEIELDASGAELVYLSLATGGVVQIADPAASEDWDLAIRRTTMTTNSGSSGRGDAGARWAAEGLQWEAIDAAPTIGFEIDAEIPLPGPPGSGTFSGNPVLNDWFNYDPSSHAVSPKPGVLLVRGAKGQYAKLQILSYTSGRYRLRLAPLSAEPEVTTATIEAVDAAAWVYFDLARGATSATTTDSWDIGFSRTKIRTNGGTSGPGNAGALDPSLRTMADLTIAPASGYAEDAMVPLPGPPGSGEFSGNPVLNEWFDYDPATHATTPKDKLFAVRLKDGGYAKLKIMAYEGGRYTITWSYAGPRRSEY